MAKRQAEIRSLARSHTRTAIKVLAGVMSSAKCPPAARVAAANALLDRGWGKPVAALEISNSASLLDCFEALAERDADDDEIDEPGAGAVH